jgi:tetratricopeptide (TPR) repeat protein
MKRWLWALVVGTCSVQGGCAFFSQPLTTFTTDRVQEKPLSESGGLTSQAKAKAQEPELPPEKSAKLCLATADEMDKAGHLDQAIAQCELARQHNPKQPGVGRKLAALYARAGQFDKAVDEYQKELAKTPKDADLLNDLGYCYYEKQDYPQAEKYLRQAIAAKASLQRAHANLGLALGRQEKWKESLDEFKKAGSLGAAHANLAAMYHAAGQDDNARRECQIALGLDSQLKAARDLLAALDEKAKEPHAIQQADMRTTTTPPTTSAVQLTEARQEVTGTGDSIRLSKPVIQKQQDEPTFRPVK